MKKLKDLGRLVENLQWFVGILNVFSSESRMATPFVRFDVTFKLLPVLFANVNKLKCNGFSVFPDVSAAQYATCLQVAK